MRADPPGGTPGPVLEAVGHNDQIALRMTGLPQALRVDRTCRNEYFIRTHIYARTGILTHVLATLSAIAVQPFLSFW